MLINTHDPRLKKNKCTWKSGEQAGKQGKIKKKVKNEEE